MGTWCHSLALHWPCVSGKSNIPSTLQIWSVVPFVKSLLPNTGNQGNYIILTFAGFALFAVGSSSSSSEFVLSINKKWILESTTTSNTHFYPCIIHVHGSFHQVGASFVIGVPACYVGKCTIYYHLLWLIINIIVTSYSRHRDWFHSSPGLILHTWRGKAICPWQRAPLWGICKFLLGLLKGHQGKDQGQRRTTICTHNKDNEWYIYLCTCIKDTMSQRLPQPGGMSHTHVYLNTGFSFFPFPKALWDFIVILRYIKTVYYYYYYNVHENIVIFPIFKIPWQG